MYPNRIYQFFIPFNSVKKDTLYQKSAYLTLHFGSATLIISNVSRRRKYDLLLIAGSKFAYTTQRMSYDLRIYPILCFF